MTEKELYSAYQAEFGVTADEARKSVEFVTNTIVTEAMKGKCAFGKVGTFKVADVKAVAARTGVKNALVPGATYDVAAKPARKKLSFGLSKSGKLIGA
ncbi:MAG: hypothetical protein DRG78_09305 [Epsilonproteobacteria bacterium]|nr:MAG: hypothetical protein DRG78_09305 [Campylobacterota bacterium]